MRHGWTPGPPLEGEPRYWTRRSYVAHRRQPSGVGPRPWLLFAWAPRPEGDDEPPRDGFLGCWPDDETGRADAERACGGHWRATRR